MDGDWSIAKANLASIPFLLALLLIERFVCITSMQAHPETSYRTNYLFNKLQNVRLCIWGSVAKSFYSSQNTLPNCKLNKTNHLEATQYKFMLSICLRWCKMEISNFRRMGNRKRVIVLANIKRFCHTSTAPHAGYTVKYSETCA